MARMNTKASSLAALIAIGLLTYACGSNAPASAPPSTPAAASTPPATPADNVNPVLAKAVPTPEIEAMTKAVAGIGPHKQTNLPPIPFRGYAPPRPPDVVTAAFMFAAEHPEITSYVPCFCGCQQGGHKGNHDCFVRSRAANGDVIEWEEHGVECAVCIDVATRSRQLLASGASVQEIRAAIEREFVPSAQTMTPTPKPPAAHSH
jgi:hypothetical protein